jgi:hypothetical protein
MLLPRRHMGALDEFTEADSRALADILSRVTRG